MLLPILLLLLVSSSRRGNTSMTRRYTPVVVRSRRTASRRRGVDGRLKTATADSRKPHLLPYIQGSFSLSERTKKHSHSLLNCPSYYDGQPTAGRAFGAHARRRNVETCRRRERRAGMEKTRRVEPENQSSLIALTCWGGAGTRRST